jgi:hypothetical protein
MDFSEHLWKHPDRKLERAAKTLGRAQRAGGDHVTIEPLLPVPARGSPLNACQAAAATATPAAK